MEKHPEKRPRVLHVVSAWGSGGSSVQIRDIIDSQLNDASCIPKLCVLGPAQTDLARPEPPEGTVFLEYPGRLKDLSSTRTCIRNLREVIDAFSPDLLHVYLWPSSLISALALREKNIPVVYHVLDTRPWLKSRRLRHRVQRMIYYPALKKTRAHFIACAVSVKQFIEAYLPQARGHTSVILNAVNPSVFDGQREERPDHTGKKAIIGNVGRLTEEKGQRYLLEAASILKQRGIPFHLRFAGVGTMKSQYIKMAEASGILDCIEFLHLDKDAEMAAFYRNVDMLVLSSLTEGLPLTLLEAMAMRLPVIASDIDGIPEAVTNGKEGFLVPARHPVALADAIEKLARDPALRKRMGEKGYARVHRQFDSRIYARQISPIYENLLRDSP